MCVEVPKELPGEGVVKYFKRQGKWLSVFLRKDAEIKDLLNIRILGGFSPAPSPESARQVYGAPYSTTKEKYTSTLEYKTTSGRVQLVFYFDGEHNVRSLNFYPHDRRPRRLLNKIVLNRTNLKSDEEVIMIYEYGYAQPKYVAELSVGQLNRLAWNYDDDLARE